MKPINFKKLLGTVVCLLSFLLQGCVQDDLSVCGIRLAFNYGTDENKFPSNVGDVHVYVFDSKTGLFVNEYSATTEQLVSGYILPINLSAGTYDFIAWGNIEKDYATNSFIRGVTSFDEARLMHTSVNKILTEYPDILFYGALRNRKISAADLTAVGEITIDMVKNSKTIHVITKGLYDSNSNVSDPANPVFHCSITSKNGNYKFDNYPTGDQYTYIPQEFISTEDLTLRSDFIVLREFGDNSLTNSRLRLFHRDGNTRQEQTTEVELLNLSLTECLLTVASVNEIENTEEFTVEIVVSSNTNGSVSITVNNWQYTGNQLILR